MGKSRSQYLLFLYLIVFHRAVSGGDTKECSKTLGSWHAEIWKVRDLFVCDGAVIDKRWILAAAHCFRNVRDIESLGAVIFNVHETRKKNYERMLGIARIVPHPDYDLSAAGVGAALIELSEELELGGQTGRLCMEYPHMIGNSAPLSCYVLHRPENSATLQKYQMRLLNPGTCDTTSTSDMLCALSEWTDFRNCHGKEGTILVCKHSNGQHFVRGVLSKNFGCQNAALYAPVEKIKNWIWSTIRHARSRTLMGARRTYDAISDGKDPCSGNGTTLTGTQGNFASPGYDGLLKYALNIKCSWTIYVPENHKVLLEFDKFDVELFGSCSADWVKVYSGDVASDNNMIGQICGNFIPADQLSKSNVMFVEFNSDFLQGDLGFIARFSAVPVDTPDSTCGSPRVIRKETVISSRSYPMSFISTPGEGCIWEIEAPVGTKILFHFIHYVMDIGSENELRIYNGKDTESTWYQTFRDDFSPRNEKVLTGNNTAVVEFKVWNYMKQTEGGFYATVRFILPSDTSFYPDAIDMDQEEYTGYCGYQKILPTILTPAGGLIGVSEAIANSWPWQVNLRHAIKPTTKPYCGGTVVSSAWILTAAHCINHTVIYVFAGDHTFDKTDYKKQISKVKQKIKHPKLRELATWDNDLALLELEHPFTFTDFVRPACIPTPDVEFPNGAVCYVTGWGRTDENLDGGTLTLHEIPIPIISREKCEEIYVTEFTENMICAGHLEGTVDSCQGDSGGPLVCHKPGQYSWVLYGITSWGWGCGKENFPGVYVRLNRYGTWLKNVTDYEVTQNYDNSGHMPPFEPTTPVPPTPVPTTPSPTTPMTGRIASPLPPCSSPVLIEGGEGGITPPNRPSDYEEILNCSWTIRATHTAGLMKVTFKNFNMRNSACGQNYLTISMTDVYNNVTSVETFCGTRRPPDYSAYSLEFIFISEKSVSNGTGFRAIYEETDPCKGKAFNVENKTTGNIFNPNYPNKYPKNKRCSWFIPSMGLLTELDIKYLQLPSSSDGTCLDSITVRTPDHILGPYCDLSTVKVVQAEGDVMVLFESTNLKLQQNSGFFVSYEHYAPVELFQNTDDGECFSMYFVNEAGNITGSKQSSINGSNICDWTVLTTMDAQILLTVTPWGNMSYADCDVHNVKVSYGETEKQICLDQPETRTYAISDDTVVITLNGPTVEYRIGFNASFKLDTQSTGYITRPCQWSYMLSILFVKYFK